MQTDSDSLKNNLCSQKKRKPDVLEKRTRNANRLSDSLIFAHDLNFNFQFSTSE